MQSRVPRLISLLVLSALLLAACSSARAANGPDRAGSATVQGPCHLQRPRPLRRLRVFPCDYVISHGVDLVGPYGLGDPFGGPIFARAGGVTTMAAAEDAASEARGQVDPLGHQCPGSGCRRAGHGQDRWRAHRGPFEGTLMVADVSGTEPEVVDASR